MHTGHRCDIAVKPGLRRNDPSQALRTEAAMHTGYRCDIVC
jgi:hypothetical protein